MNNKIASPHDKVFKHVMSNLNVAKDFFTHHLPAYLRDKIDLSSLAIRKESYIDQELRNSMTDMLYSVDFLGDEQGYLYVLVEHQSQAQVLMPFRLLKYTLRIIEQHLKEQKTDVLPVVYPMIFFNGKQPYPYSTSLFDLFGPHAALAKELFSNPFQLIDLTQIPDEELRSHQWAGLMEFMMKHVFARDIIPKIKQVVDLINYLENNGSEDYVLAILKYVVSTAEIKSKSEFLAELTTALSPPLGEKAMTLADMLRAEGIQQGHLAGLQEGMEKGIEKGRVEGMHEMIVRLLRSGLKVDVIANATQLSVEQVEEIAHSISKYH